MYNIVGFQTHLTWPEQRRVFALIPGLENLKYVLRSEIVVEGNAIEYPSKKEFRIRMRTGIIALLRNGFKENILNLIFL